MAGPLITNATPDPTVCKLAHIRSSMIRTGVQILVVDRGVSVEMRLPDHAVGSALAGQSNLAIWRLSDSLDERFVVTVYGICLYM